MILSAFDLKFNEKKDEIPPGACKRLKKFQKLKKKWLEMGPPPVRPPEREVRRAAAPRKGKKGVRGAAPPRLHPGYILRYYPSR